MAKELGPQNLEELSRQAGTVSRLLNKANSLVSNVGGPDWPERFQAQNIPEEIFFDQSRKLVGIAEKIRQNSIPSLTKREERIQTAIVSQVELEVEYLREQIKIGNLSPQFLERGQSILDGLKAELPSFPPEQATPDQSLSEESRTEEVDQNTLTFNVGNKVTVVSKRERYEMEDIGIAIANSDLAYVRHKFAEARRNNPTISAQPSGVGKANKKLLLDEENFIITVTDIIPTMGPLHKRSARIEEQPILPEDQKISPISQADQPSKQVVAELVIPEQPVTAAQGETSTVNPTEKPQEMLVIPGYNSIPKKESYTSDDFAKIFDMSITLARTRIYRIKQLDNSIQGTPLGAGHESRRLLYPTAEFMKLVDSEVIRQKGSTQSPSPPKIPKASDTSTTKSQYADDLLGPPVVEISGIPVDQARAPATFSFKPPEFSFTPEAPVATIAENLETTIFAANGQDSTTTLPEEDNQITPKPLPKRSPAASRTNETTKAEMTTLRNAIVNKSALEILNKFTSGRYVDISPNIRVTYGHHLPDRTTIPQVFGQTVSQEKLNEALLNSLHWALNRWWNRDPNSTEDLSEEESRTAAKVRDLRSSGRHRTPQEVINTVRNILKN